MRKVIFIDGFLQTEVSRFAADLSIALEGFEMRNLPMDFKDMVKMFSDLRETESNYIFNGSPYSAFVSSLFGRKRSITQDQLLMFENSFSGFYFFVDANDDYVAQLYKTLNKKLTNSHLSQMELFRFLFAKSNMPLKLTYTLHEPNAKAKFLEEFKEVYADYLISTTDYRLLQAT